MSDGTVHGFFKGMDWEALRGQKQALLGTIRYEESQGNRKVVEQFQGILHLLDDLQDVAVDDYGEDHEKVFGFPRDDD